MALTYLLSNLKTQQKIIYKYDKLITSISKLLIKQVYRDTILDYTCTSIYILI